MADFVAVIRRAVDGLSDNTPEMRVKVYEKARGAVLRQLENMKPRPPEDMLRRQIDKLESAISEVEAEYAVALPGIEDEPGADDASEAVHDAPEALDHAPEVNDPVDETQVDADPEPVSASVEYAPEPAEYASVDEEHAAVAPVADEDVDPEPQPVSAEQKVEWLPEEPAAGLPLQDGPEEFDAQRQRDDARAEEPAQEPPVVDEPWQDVAAPSVPERSADNRWDDFLELPAARDGRKTPDDAQSAPPELDRLSTEPAHHPDPEWASVGPTASPEEAETSDPHGQETAFVAPGPAPLPVDPPARAAVDDVDQWGDLGVPPPAQPADAPAMPKASASPDSSNWDLSPFDDVPLPKSTAAQRPGDETLDPLLGDLGVAAPGAERIDRGHDEALLADLPAAAVGRDARTKREKATKQKVRNDNTNRRINVAAIAAGVAAVVLIGGAGAAAWLYKDDLTTFVSQLSDPAPDLGGTPTATNNTTAPASTTTPGVGSSASAPGASTANIPPAADGAIAGSKFNQRLLADGSEVDEGPGPQPGTDAVAEGKSVAEQNVASAGPVAPAAGAAPAATETPGTPPATLPPATPDSGQPTAPQQASPVTVGQKMFLYEERLGQSVPTAIEGRVVWSIQQEDAGGGKTEPAVQGQISIPERGLTALLTFKRNTDPSLPASHLVEIVFSIPGDFEGGAIDSVQRISMKQTEQDRGSPLIAVPAKITDDFHMIALNDFPDAMKSNLDLMKTRNWMDIPLIYRNGRRALLTLDKGSTGADAFNKAINEWAALGPAPTGQ